MSVHNDGRARCLKVTRNGRVIRKRVDLITRVLCRARGEGWDFTRAIIRFAVGIRRRANERDGRFVDFQASLRSLLEIIKRAPHRRISQNISHPEHRATLDRVAIKQ